MWRDKFEKKNLAIFQEISNAMKGLKQEMSVEKKENVSRVKDLREEVETFQRMNEKLVANMKEHVDRTQASTEFLIKENDAKHTDALHQSVTELEKLLADADERCLDKAKTFTTISVAALDTRIREEIGEFVNNYPRELTRRMTQLKEELQGEIYKADEKMLDKHKSGRLYTEELHDLVMQQLAKDRKDHGGDKSGIREEIKQAKREALDGLKAAIDQVTADVRGARGGGEVHRSLHSCVKTQSRLGISDRQQEMNAAMLRIELERQINESSAKGNENLHKMRNELIEQFRAELDANVLQRLLKEIELEKNDRMRRETEIETNMHNVKNMLLETIH